MKNITLLDGAVGTSLWAKADKYGVKRVPVWKYNIENPEMVKELVRDYRDAGSQIILANTFGANGPSVKRSSDYKPYDVVNTGVKLAREALEGSDAKLAMGIGPLSQLMEPYGDLEEDEVTEIYDEMIGAGMDAGADIIYIQTFMDLAMASVAAKVAKQYKVPVFCSLTFEQRGKTMMGNSVEDIIEELQADGVDAVGMNCSLGPDLALPIIREFSEKTDMPIIFKPNAGLPITAASGEEASPYTAEMFLDEIKPALEYVDYIGGCCGTDPSYIKLIKEYLDSNR